MTFGDTSYFYQNTSKFITGEIYIKNKRLVRILILVGIIILSFVVAAFITGKFEYREQLDASKTVEKIADNVYIMEYIGDYGFDRYLEEGGGATAEEMADYLYSFMTEGLLGEAPEDNHGYSTIAAVDKNGNHVFGRNYDWQDGTNMIIRTVPNDGYESVSVTALEFLGFGDDFKPVGMAKKLMAQSAIYIPMDGMNEKGLVIADLMAGDEEETHQDNGKADITTTAGIRLVLDHAATVDEAIALLSSYDMHSDIGMAHHYAISDATGRSVVVEYIDNEMVVTEIPVVTNHYLYEGEKNGVGSAKSHERFETLTRILDENNGTLSANGIRDALEAVCQKNMGSEYDITRWSCVYEQEKKRIHLHIGEDYKNCYTIQLGTEEWFL